MHKVLAAIILFGFSIFISTGAECAIHETIGLVESFDGEHLHVTGEPLTVGGYSDIVINISHAPIFDLLTGHPVPIDCQGFYNNFIEVGMSVRIAFTDNMEALAVWLNFDYEEAAAFSVVVSDNIQYGKDYAVFLCMDGKYRITLAVDTIIIDPLHGEITLADVIPGQEYFVWVDMITASSPAQVYPNKVVLIND